MATSTGSLKTFFDANYLRTSTGSLKTLFDANYFRTSTGSLKTFFDLQYLRTSTGSLKTFFDANYLRTSTGSLRTLFDSRYMATSTGSLRAAFDNRYVSASGDTMTGGLLIVNGGHSLPSVEAGILLEVAGVMSGRTLRAQDLLQSSGSLVVQTTGFFRGNLTTQGVLSGASLVVSGGIKTNSGIVIQRQSDSNFLTLKDTSNSKSVGIYSGSGSPWNKISASTGSLYLDNYYGNAYLRVAGGAGGKSWKIIQVGTGTGSSYPDRAVLWHQESSVTAGNAIACTADANQLYSIYCSQSAAAQNDAFTNGFFLRAGTYTFSALGLTSSNKGAIDWYIDGTLAVTAQDWYTAGGAFNAVKTATVTVSNSGYHTLKGIVSTKNGSSSAYNMLLTKMWFVPSIDQTHVSPGADYAEWFRATPDSNGALPQKGELVCIDVTAPNAVRKCENEGDPNVMGIVSTNPSFVGNDRTFDGLPIPGTVLVGLIGQIPAKATVESGAVIRPGDGLTPASHRATREALAGEPTVGVALEGLERGEGTVQVLVAQERLPHRRRRQRPCAPDGERPEDRR